MSLVKFDDPILHKPAREFYFSEHNEINPKDLANSLIVTKNARNAFGLAAPQIGIPYRVFAFLEDVAFNPEVIQEWGPYELHEEGCLSYPGIFAMVERSTESLVKYQNHEGQWIERHVSGLENIVFLHEYDHLNGTCFVNLLSDFKLRRAINQANKHGYDYTFAKVRGC